jgi:hypothetical protein
MPEPFNYSIQLLLMGYCAFELTAIHRREKFSTFKMLYVIILLSFIAISLINYTLVWWGVAPADELSMWRNATATVRPSLQSRFDVIPKTCTCTQSPPTNRQAALIVQLSFAISNDYALYIPAPILGWLRLLFIQYTECLYLVFTDSARIMCVELEHTHDGCWDCCIYCQIYTALTNISVWFAICALW